MSRGEDLSDQERAVVQRNIIAFRKQLGEQIGEAVTQERLAELAGLSLDTVRGYEQNRLDKKPGGRRAPDRKAAMKLCQVFGCSVEDLFSENPGPLDPTKRVAVATKVIGPLDADLRQRLMDFVAGVNREQLGRVKALKDKQRKKRPQD